MRVLFLTDSLSDLDGVGRYCVRLIEALERLEPGLEVEILLARKHRPTSSAVPAHWRVRVALPPDYFFHMRGAKFWWSFLSAAWNVSRAARRADLVHAIKDYPHNFAGAWGARIAGVPAIATAHGTYSVQPLLDARHARRARWTYRQLAGLISVSRYTARRLEALLETKDRPRGGIVVIPNAVSASHYDAPRNFDTPRPWHGLDFTLGIGELKQRKGHHLALAAWIGAARRFPGLHHFIVGKSSADSYHAGLVEILRVAGMSDRVHFLGNVSEDEKIDLLQRARLFLHTPVTAEGGGFEGFGIVYLEAAAAGIASIGTLDCGAEDAIVDGVTGRLVKQDPRAVEEALVQLLGDETLLRKLGVQAREHARRSPWDDNARRVLEMYRAALEPKR
ncbi:MAG TPA: glycosyltransferase family 4 protein [Planctomycetota bacterium]|nr:glycosyltransferase family 4 protein [Planctomycetota bacterium]